jgi:hypothetical protein
LATVPATTLSPQPKPTHENFPHPFRSYSSGCIIPVCRRTSQSRRAKLEKPAGKTSGACFVLRLPVA